MNSTPETPSATHAPSGASPSVQPGGESARSHPTAHTQPPKKWLSWVGVGVLCLSMAAVGHFLGKRSLEHGSGHVGSEQNSAGGDDPESHADVDHQGHSTSPSNSKEAAHPETHPGWWSGMGHALLSIQTRVQQIREMDLELHQLKLENAHLRVQLEQFLFSKKEEHAHSQSEKIEDRNLSETGHETGRTPAQIPYEVPKNLMPYELYTLSISYLKNKEDEKAAKILAFLTQLKSSDAYKTPKNFLLAGIAWYRLDHFQEAEKNFDQAIRFAPNESYEAYQSQARLWKAIAAQRSGKHTKAQFWLSELLDHHPQSLEAGWVNRGDDSEGGQREPAHSSH